VTLNPARAAGAAGACLARAAAAALLAAAVATAAEAVTLAPGWEAAGDARARAALILDAPALPVAPTKSVAARLAAGPGAAIWRDRLTAWRARALAPAPPRPMLALLAAAADRPAIDGVADSAAARARSLTMTAARRGAPAAARLREVVLDETSPVPLPGGGWLLVSGLGGLAALARRRRG